MLSCEQFADRLYDEDCRRALEAHAAVPADVAVHRDACTACSRLWLEAARDLELLREATGPAPVSLERRLRIQLADRAAPRSPLREAWTLARWTLVGAAIALAAAPLLPWPYSELGLTTLAGAGASLAFAAAAAGQTLAAVRR